MIIFINLKNHNAIPSCLQLDPALDHLDLLGQHRLDSTGLLLTLGRTLQYDHDGLP